MHPALAHISPLKAERVGQVDFMVVRELTGGSYFGDKVEGDDFASDSLTYTREEVERVVRLAADMARQRYGRLTMIDKANVLATSRLWRAVTTDVMSKQFPDVAYEFMLVDAAAMHIVANPSRFNVIVTENMFGDILTDEAAVLSGSLGLLPSASLGDGPRGLYEPIHGSAPDIAGQGLANPTGTILSAAMLCRHSLGLPAEAARIETAVARAIADGARTRDLGGALSTSQMGAAVRERL
jgi:3-isopropylmalate dehydrogenase